MGYPKITFQEDQVINSCEAGQASWVITSKVRPQAAKEIFTNYFNIALKSANESKLWLALLRDSKRVKPGDVEWFLQEVGEISNIFASSILTLKGKK